MVDVVYTDEFEAWWDGLTEVQQGAVAAHVDVLADKGTALGEPLSSAIKCSSIALRELKAQSGGRPLRVFYVFDPDRQAVLLTGGDKTGKNSDRWYLAMARLSEAIYAQYLEERKGRRG